MINYNIIEVRDSLHRYQMMLLSLVVKGQGIFDVTDDYIECESHFFYGCQNVDNLYFEKTRIAKMCTVDAAQIYGEYLMKT